MILALTIGAGGWAESRRHTDTRLGRIVAVKLLASEFSQRFETEARAISAVNHPNICALYDIGTHEGRGYLVLEYLEGKPLTGPLPADDALRVAVQIATALEAAHRKGITHRDLKPANIMIAEDGSVKLLDFGLAKLAAVNGTDITRTIAGTVMGTAAYMAPEQAEGRPLDARSDIFSLGAVVYELIAGRRAFPGESMASVLSAVLRDEPAAAGIVAPGARTHPGAMPQKECSQTVTKICRRSMTWRRCRTPAVLSRHRWLKPAKAASIACRCYANLSVLIRRMSISATAEEIINGLTRVVD